MYIMDYISRDEFLRQSDKVQREFKEYFDCETMLFYSNAQLIYGEFNDILINTPALTEGPLRKFIEDKLKRKVQNIWSDNSYCISVDIKGQQWWRKTNETDLLQDYWTVACEIAKEM